MMKNLIIPCAGRSTRFPNMKPKWILTHPDGQLMVEKALNCLDTSIFDRIIITLVKQHEEEYQALTILNQVFAENKKIEFCVLENFTQSASETVYRTCEQMNITGAMLVKDSDNAFGINISKDFKNFVVGYDLNIHKDVTNIPAKSFLIINEQNLLLDIVEKQVVSHIICLGGYAFENVEEFKKAFLDISRSISEKELFISHVISYMLRDNKTSFSMLEASSFEDWGTLEEWEKVQKRFRTYFVDVDGVLMKNTGRYGSVNWSNNKTTIPENMKSIKNLQDNGAQIIITTSRTEEFRKDLENILSENGIRPYAILMGMNHAARIVINDFCPTNPYPSAVAINVPRNGSLSSYL